LKVQLSATRSKTYGRSKRRAGDWKSEGTVALPALSLRFLRFGESVWHSDMKFERLHRRLEKQEHSRLMQPFLALLFAGTGKAKGVKGDRVVIFSVSVAPLVQRRPN